MWNPFRKNRRAVDVDDILLRIAPNEPYSQADMRQLHADMRTVFEASERGKRVLNAILAECHLYAPLYTPNTDPHVTVFREGRRSVALFILGILSGEAIDMSTHQQEDQY